MSEPRYCSVLYCDDVRKEEGGKLSFMGVYASDMYIQKIPTVLAKLCIQAKVITPADRPLKSLSLAVSMNDEILIDMALEAKDLHIPEDIRDSGRIFVIPIIFTLSPFQIAAPGMLRVNATTESEELIGGGLRVMEIPEETRPV